MTHPRPAGTVRCALHVHSTYSDGEFTLAELRELFLKAGVRVVCMADHDYYFTPERVADYVGECTQLSDDRLQFIPGLEFECTDRMHVLGYGVTTLAGDPDPERVFGHIEEEGGVSVIAHPRDAHFPWIEGFTVLPMGVEVWNSKYDGRYAPRARTFDLYRRLRARRPEMRAFYGQDLHWRTQFRALYTDVRASSPAREAVLRALAAGEFEGVHGEMVLPSDGTLDAGTLARFDALNARSNRLWRALKAVKGMTGWLGRHLPAPVKAQLRRLF